jgi:hypothetical protein
MNRTILGSAWRADWFTTCLRAAGVFLVALAAFGQGQRGSITGKVRDPVGGIVADASVQATNASTGMVYKSSRPNRAYIH